MPPALSKITPERPKVAAESNNLAQNKYFKSHANFTSKVITYSDKIYGGLKCAILQHKECTLWHLYDRDLNYFLRIWSIVKTLTLQLTHLQLQCWGTTWILKATKAISKERNFLNICSENLVKILADLHLSCRISATIFTDAQRNKAHRSVQILRESSTWVIGAFFVFENMPQSICFGTIVRSRHQSFRGINILFLFLV